MIYGSSQGQSALGSLLRKMQEESMANPTNVPVSAGESSPIRQQIQGPLNSPEAVGSEKVVSMKPELAPSMESPSPVAATTPMDSGIIPPVGAMKPSVPGFNAPVGPTNIPSSPQISSGITSPTTPMGAINTPQSSPTKGITTSAVKSSSPIGPQPLLPSSAKSTMQQVNSLPQSYLAKGSTSTNRLGGGTTKNISAPKVGAGSLLPSVLSGLGNIGSTIGGTVSGLAGTLMSKDTMNKILDSFKYGGKKVTQG